jgi:hypothetical protein
VSFHSTIRLIQRMVLLSLALLCVMPRAASAGDNRVVMVVGEAESAAQSLEEELVAALRGQLRELDVDVLVVRATQEPLGSAARRAKQLARTQAAVGVIWIEHGPGTLSAYLYDSSGHLYAREVEADGSVASQSEAIALILRSAIAAMLEGGAMTMTEIRLPPSAPAPAAVERRLEPARTSAGRTSAVLRAGASYVGTLFARDTAWLNGAAILLSVKPPKSRWLVGVDYTHFSGLELQGNGVTTRLERHPVEVFGGLQLRVSWVYLDVQGALSADYVTRTTERAEDGLVSTAPSERWLWAFATRLGATVPASGPIQGAVNVGAEFLLNPFQQVIRERNTTDERVGAPLLARPRVELGVIISIW